MLSAWLYVIRFDVRVVSGLKLTVMCVKPTQCDVTGASAAVWRSQRTTVSSVKLTQWWSCSWPPVPCLVTRLNLVLCWNWVHLVYLRLLTEERQASLFTLCSLLCFLSLSFPLSTSSLMLWYTYVHPFPNISCCSRTLPFSHTYRECNQQRAVTGLLISDQVGFHAGCGSVSQQRCVCVC